VGHYCILAPVGPISTILFFSFSLLNSSPTSFYISVHPSIYPSIYLSIHLSIYLDSYLSFFFFFFVGLGFELRAFQCLSHTFKAGTLLFEPHLQSILPWLFWRCGFVNCLIGPTLKCDPPDLSLPSGWDYRYEPLLHQAVFKLFAG
jgi:hypothetical protein